MEAGPERPLVTYMLDHRSDLALTPAQVEELERIRSDFQKEAIKVDADQRVAEMDVASSLRADPVDIGRVEAKIREAERLKADFRVGRVRAIERAKAQLTPEQRAKLATMLGETQTIRPRAQSF
jgi:Spy/CpxP family protein refolding chaperone